jgi:hypothetical protein
MLARALEIDIAINEVKALFPEWFLYGEKALLKKAELLKRRTNDDPFNPQIISLKYQLKEIQKNNLLKTLETRQNDEPFIPEIVKLDIEQTKLDSTIVDLTDVKSMRVSHLANTTSIGPNKRWIVLRALIVSFIMSIFLVLVMGAIKPDEEHST